jgi:hypothetical protein
MAVKAQLRAVGKVAGELDEERAEVEILAVEAVLVDHHAGAHDPWVARPGLAVAAFFGAKRGDLLLRHPNR